MTTPAPQIRKTYSREDRKRFDEQMKARQAAIAGQRELWSAINLFVARNGAWLISAPGERPLRIEVPLYSELPDKLHDLGYDLYPPEGSSGERIEGGKILQTLRFQFQIPLPR
jgi:hypothetical protein